MPKDAAGITLDSRAIHYGELRIVGASDSRPEHVEKAVRLLHEGKINVEPIVTHRVPLDALLDGIGLMEEKRSLKVMVYP
jgi:L-iditol 2-dehydrogenase